MLFWTKTKLVNFVLASPDYLRTHSPPPASLCIITSWPLRSLFSFDLATQCLGWSAYVEYTAHKPALIEAIHTSVERRRRRG